MAKAKTETVKTVGAAVLTRTFKAGAWSYALTLDGAEVASAWCASIAADMWARKATGAALTLPIKTEAAAVAWLTGMMG